MVKKNHFTTTFYSFKLLRVRGSRRSVRKMPRSTQWPERCRRSAAATKCRQDRAQCSSRRPLRRLHRHMCRGLLLAAARRQRRSATTGVTLSRIVSRKLRDHDDFKEAHLLLVARSKTMMTSQLRRHIAPA